jgi:hypothetical protein
VSLSDPGKGTVRRRRTPVATDSYDLKASHTASTPQENFPFPMTLECHVVPVSSPKLQHRSFGCTAVSGFLPASWPLAHVTHVCLQDTSLDPAVIARDMLADGASPQVGRRVGGSVGPGIQSVSQAVRQSG